VKPDPSKIAPPPALGDREPDSAVDAAIAKATEGYRPVGVQRGRLESWKQATFKVQRGLCYKILVVMEKGARPWRDSRWIKYDVRTAKQVAGSGGGANMLGLRVQDVESDYLCPYGPGKLEIQFEEKPAGEGPYSLRVFSKPADEGALRDRETDDAQSWCQECRRRRLVCIATGESGGFKTCTAQFRSCTAVGDTAKVCPMK
ncbi:MAG: hypothetical protein AB7P03_27130, partial [Kofleriaceae bacterium]